MALVGRGGGSSAAATPHARDAPCATTRVAACRGAAAAGAHPAAAGVGSGRRRGQQHQQQRRHHDHHAAVASQQRGVLPCRAARDQAGGRGAGALRGAPTTRRQRAGCGGEAHFCTLLLLTLSASWPCQPVCSWWLWQHARFRRQWVLMSLARLPPVCSQPDPEGASLAASLQEAVRAGSLSVKQAAASLASYLRQRQQQAAAAAGSASSSPGHGCRQPSSVGSSGVVAGTALSPFTLSGPEVRGGGRCSRG